MLGRHNNTIHLSLWLCIARSLLSPSSPPKSSSPSVVRVAVAMCSETRRLPDDSIYEIPKSVRCSGSWQHTLQLTSLYIERGGHTSLLYVSLDYTLPLPRVYLSPSAMGNMQCHRVYELIIIWPHGSKHSTHSLLPRSLCAVCVILVSFLTIRWQTTNGLGLRNKRSRHSIHLCRYGTQFAVRNGNRMHTKQCVKATHHSTHNNSDNNVVARSHCSKGYLSFAPNRRRRRRWRTGGGGAHTLMWWIGCLAGLMHRADFKVNAIECRTFLRSPTLCPHFLTYFSILTEQISMANVVMWGHKPRIHKNSST